MPWPSEITRAFATVGGLADIVIRGKDYHGPYNKLLSTLFPPDSDFIVSPTYIPHDIDPDADPKLFSFEVMLHEHPVLVLEIKPPQHLSFDSTRGTADMEIRRHLVDCSRRALLPILYGISAMGTKLSFYELERAPRIMTPRGTGILSDPEFTVNIGPREWWDCDVLEADGEQRLRALVTHITEACKHLQG